MSYVLEMITDFSFADAFLGDVSLYLQGSLAAWADQAFAVAFSHETPSEF